MPTHAFYLRLDFKNCEQKLMKKIRPILLDFDWFIFIHYILFSSSTIPI